ncbi:MAG: ferredoxin-thioredoxin reductase catalytic domain-containing protein [Candidatus Heimdallarchaeota archaeon]
MLEPILNLSKIPWTFEQMLEWAKGVAAKKGWQLNPNDVAVKMTIEGLIENQRIYRRRYCPCRRVTRNPEKDRSIICPCIYSANEIEQKGVCHCGLFATG